MSQYFNFLKNGTVSFDKVLIEKYSLIGLDETDTILLIKLHKLIETNSLVNESVITNDIKNSMSISENEIKERLVKLITTSYISLDLVDNKEVYSLDDTYKRLANLIDDDEETEKKNDNNTELKKAVSFIEKECGHVIAPNELEVIKHWIDVDNFNFNQIKDATLECLKHKKKQIKYIDSMLKKDQEVVKQKNNNTTDLDELFNSVYGRTKR